MKFSFLIFAVFICSVSASNLIRTDAETQVLFDEKLVMKISSYLPNPFLNLAKISKTHWTLFRSMTPAPFLVTRLGFKEASILTDFDKDAKLFFNLDRRNFLHTATSFLLESKRTAYSRLSERAKKVLVLGAVRFMIRKEYIYSSSFTEKVLEHVFHALIEQEEFLVAVELFRSFNDLLIPSIVVDEDDIHGFLKELSHIKLSDLERFRDIHVPSIFSFILKHQQQQQTLDQTKFVLNQLEWAFLTNSTHFSNLITMEICKKLMNFLKEPVQLTWIDFYLIYERNLVLLDWITRKGQSKNSIFINFLQDMNFIRFKLPAPDTVLVDNIFKKWMRINASYYNERVLNVALQTKFFMTAVNNCLSAPISPQFKFALRKHPEIIKSLSKHDLHKLHSLDLQAVTETLILVHVSFVATYNIEQIESLLNALTDEQLKEVNYSNLSLILVKLCSGSYDINLERRFSLLESILTILSSSVGIETLKEPILIVEEFFISILSNPKGISILKNTIWRIEGKTLANLLKPENSSAFITLKDSDIFNFITVNFYDLVPLVSLEDWTDRLCPLFTLNPMTQFERVNGFMWPPVEEIIKEIDSVLEGKRPVLNFVNDPSTCNILPRLVYNSLSKQLNTTSLLRLWSRSCIVTFILFAPDSIILSIVHKENIIKKWLIKRPDDDQFNWRFASVFLDENISLEFESKYLADLEFNHTVLFPFLNRYKPVIKAHLDFIINWDSVLSEAKSLDDFEKIVRITSHPVALKAFEEDEKLQIKFRKFYRHLFDFDFVCSL